MELKQYLTLAWRWLWLILLMVIGAAAVALVVGVLTVPVYSATATVLVNQAPRGDLTDAGALTTGQRLAQTYVELLTKRPVLEEAIGTAGLKMSAGQLAGATKVTIVSDTGLISIQVENQDPVLAARLANLIPSIFAQQNASLQASRYADTLDNLSQELASLNEQIQQTQAEIVAAGAPRSTNERADLTRLQEALTQLREGHTTLLQTYENTRLAEAQSTSNIQIVEPAVVPGSPVRPKILQNTLLAATVGLMLAVGLVFLIEYLDDRLRSPEQVFQALGVPVVGTVGRFNGAEKGQAKQKSQRLIAASTPRSPVVEAFRTLRTNIRFSSVDVPVRSLLVTSVAPAEGKSTISGNLAIVLAQAGLRVLLMDADLRRPSVHRLFESPNRNGLTDMMLQPSANWDKLPQTSPIPNLYVMPSGALPPNPSELLGSDRFQQLLQGLTAKFDMVIIDSPPLLPVTDSAILARIVDGVLLVVDADRTRTGMLRQGKEHLDRVNARVLGVVMNKIQNGRDGYAYYYDYYYYGKRPGDTPSKNGNSKPEMTPDSLPEDAPVGS